MRRLVLPVLLAFLPAHAYAYGIGWGPTTKRAKRHDVTCPMTSDTCSDGRKITTVRASSVPCEVSPGQWVDVPANVGCYGVRGLESWAQTTSYLSWGRDFSRPAWSKASGATVEEVAGGSWRVHGTASSSFMQQLTATAQGETWTASCIMRAGTSRKAGLHAVTVAAGGVLKEFDLTDEWATYSNTVTATAAGSAMVGVYPARAGAGYMDVAGCWLTKSATPGRPLWGGEAPVSSGPDNHTISTAGWPTTAGEISITFTVGASEKPRYIVDGRMSGATTNSLLMVDTAGRLRVDLVAGKVNLGPVLALDVAHHARLVMAGGRTHVFVNGGLVFDLPDTPTWGAAATVGQRWTNDEAINGSISRLSWRSR